MGVFRPSEGRGLNKFLKKLLQRNGLCGLDTIKETTKVSLSKVKDAINNGKDANKSKQEIIDGVVNEYEKKAVKSYLDQYPLH